MGMGQGEEVSSWECGNCKRVVGIGKEKPNISKCPYCGVAIQQDTPWWGYVLGGVLVVGVLGYRMGFFRQ
jgi:hypothetical protein